MKSLSRAWLLVTPWTAAYQAPPSMGFSRQEYWSGLPLPSPSALSTLSQNKLTLREACPLKYLSQRADASSLHPRAPEVYLSSLPLNSSSFGPWQFPAAPAQVSLSPGQWVLVSPLCPSALQSGSASTAQRILSEPFTDAQSILLRALLWQLQLSLSLSSPRSSTLHIQTLPHPAPDFIQKVEAIASNFLLCPTSWWTDWVPDAPSSLAGQSTCVLRPFFFLSPGFSFAYFQWALQP